MGARGLDDHSINVSSSETGEAPSKFNLTDKLGLTSSLATPNVDKLIYAVSTLLRDQMLEDQDQPKPDNAQTSIFNEVELSNFTPQQQTADRVTGDHDSCGDDEKSHEALNSVAEIFKFIKTIFVATDCSAECNILCYIYINRLLLGHGIPLGNGNWRPIVLIAIILAQKVWDDTAVSIETFSALFPLCSVEDILRLENGFLRLIDFKTLVTPATYARYYFELRDMFVHPRAEATVCDSDAAPPKL